jgi:hypothetical protein
VLDVLFGGLNASTKCKYLDLHPNVSSMILALPNPDPVATKLTRIKFSR